jgi:hypothetical protein
VALANLKSPFADPGAIAPPSMFDPKQLAQTMQTDPNTRTMMSQFFGDPTSRSFIQDSGTVTNAISRPDNPWTPGTSIAPAPSAPASGVPSAGVPVNPPSPTYATAQDFSAAHPEAVNVPARPVAPLDDIHGARKALMLAFLGLNKFGAGLSHQDNSYADQFLGQQLERTTAQQQYDKSAPQLKTQAENAAFDKYLGEQEHESNIANVGSEINFRNRTVPPQILQQQEQLRAFMSKAQDTWTKDPRFIGNPQAFAQAMKAESSGLPVQDSDLQQIMKLPQTGTKYSIEYSKEGGVPTGLRDNLGKLIPPDQIKALGDPQATAAWTQAQQAHDTARSEKRSDEAYVAGEAASRQAATFQHADIEKGRESATKHLADLRDAQTDGKLIEDLLGGKFNPAKQTSAIFKLVGINQPTGSHRVMPSEIDAVRHVGGFTDRAAQWFANAKEGDQFPKELIPDVIDAARTITASKVKQANDKLEDNHRVYGYAINGADANGRLDGAPSIYAPASQQAPPAGAGGQKTATKAHIAAYAAAKGISVDAANDEFTKSGYTITEK